MIVRDFKTNSLLCDYPKASIVSIHKVRKCLFRIQLNTRKADNVAVELVAPVGKESNCELDFLKHIGGHEIAYVDKSTDVPPANGKSCLGSTFPALDDPKTKLLIFELLVSEEFEEFTLSLQQMIEGVQDKLTC
jgi:hypothetical protein